MAQQKRKPKLKKAHAAKKKARIVRTLKRLAPKARPHKKVLRAKQPERGRKLALVKGAAAKVAAGAKGHDKAADQEQLLIAADAAPVAQPDEDVEEQAEAALSTVDSEFGRTTDPVRMYMREMGSVELLTREGEIEIAKRIEDGLRHMILAISACPTTVREILDLADKVEKDEMRIDEVVDRLIYPNATEGFNAS